MSTQVKKVYVAGPMTGIPSFNVPAFDRMAKRLRAAGLEVVSPVERDSPELRAIQLAAKTGDVAEIGGSFNGETWGQILARDVIIVADEVQAVVVLPGWANSRGARLEVFVALLCKKPVFFDLKHDDNTIVDLLEIPRLAAADAISESFQKE